MTLYAYTTPDQYLPDYINVFEAHGGIDVKVRQMIGRGHEDNEVVYATMKLSDEEGRKLMEALKKKYETGDY